MKDLFGVLYFLGCFIWGWVCLSETELRTLHVAAAILLYGVGCLVWDSNIKKKL